MQHCNQEEQEENNANTGAKDTENQKHNLDQELKRNKDDDTKVDNQFVSTAGMEHQIFNIGEEEDTRDSLEEKLEQIDKDRGLSPRQKDKIRGIITKEKRGGSNKENPPPVGQLPKRLVASKSLNL
ncbi:hypothetical protein H5410_056793 [Solanum commersonii]|uniref:Uncharacterized protein n=1 Tax=Solanum commersonii TaxID=4109 RepID=A0A9J5WL80_SOLCO|nr:hypothetical protein H5410_056793 [Solanum commersonii]